MSNDDLAAVLAEVEAKEADPQWDAWCREYRRVQENLNDEKDLVARLKRKLDESRVDAAAERLGLEGAPQPKARPEAVESPWVLPEDAAEYLGVSRRTLERMMEDSPQGVPVPWRKVGRSVRWNLSLISAWIDNLNNLKRIGRRR